MGKKPAAGQAPERPPELFEWLEPPFDERLGIREGRMRVPTRPGIGVTLSDRVSGWIREEAEIA